MAEKVSELSIENKKDKNVVHEQAPESIETLDEKDAENDIEAEISGEDDDEDEGWITPSNIKAKTKAMNGDVPLGDQFVKVACMTTDFAMQVRKTALLN